MKKPVKIVGGIVAAVILLFILLAVLVKVLVTPDGVRKTVLPIAEKKLQRQVRLGDVSISIFSGIVLKKLIIMEKVEAVPFIQAEQVRLKYQFWPLLTGKVVVNQIMLEAPQIRVIRLPDGTFNYSDITAKKETAAPEEKPAKKGVNLLVSQVTVTDGKVHYEDRSKKEAQALVLDVTGVEVDASDIAMDKQFPFRIKANLPGLSLAMDGKAADIGKKPAIDAMITAKKVNIKQLVAGLPPSLTAKMKPLDPWGAVDVRLHLAGAVATPKELLKEGEIQLTEVAFNASGQRPSLSGHLALKGRELSSRDLVLAMGNNKLSIGFSVADLLGKPLVLTSSISAARLDLDPFLQKKKPAAAAEKEKPEPGPLKLPVQASGTIQVGQAAYKGLQVTGIGVKYRLADNVLHMDEFKGNMAGGSFNSNGKIDLGQQGFAYAMGLSVSGVKAEPLVAAFAPKAAGTIFGTLSLKGQVAGKGTKSAAIKNNINGQGSYTIAQGKLTGPGLIQNLAGFLGLEQLRVVQFDKFDGSFKIINGKVVIDSTVAGRDVQITPKGTAAFDKTIDLAMDTRIAPHLAGKITRGELGKMVTDEKGWSILPLRVKGSFSSPQFRLDMTGLRKQLQQKGRQKLEQTIQEKLLKKKEGEPQRPEQELLEKGLKGIFGK